MWSIWLWGRQVGQVGPITARRQPGMNSVDERAPGVHVPGQHGVGPGLGPQLAAQLGPVAVRAEEQVGHVGARHRDRPPVHREVDHRWRPAVTRSARRVLMGTARVASIGSSGRTSTAMPHAPRLGLLPARHGLHAAPARGARRPCRAPGSGRARSVGPSSVVGRRAGAGCGAPRRGCAPPSGSRDAGRPRPPGRRCRPPRAVQASSSTMTSASERGDGGEIVVGPAPPVHPAVHVVVGDAEHGPARR